MSKRTSRKFSILGDCITRPRSDLFTGHCQIGLATSMRDFPHVSDHPLTAKSDRAPKGAAHQFGLDWDRLCFTRHP